MKHLILTLLSIVLLSSCASDKDETKDYTAQNEQEIVDYLAANNLTTAIRDDSGLYYLIEEEGEGDKPEEDENVTVVYRGYYTNGNTFDESDPDEKNEADKKGISFGLNQVIIGWKKGIPKFRPGGKGKLFIPAHLGYGSQNYNGIPGGSVLIFDITLKSIN